MSRDFTPERSDAIRRELIAHVAESSPKSVTPRPRRWLSTIGILTAGVALGGAVSAAALTLGGFTDWGEEGIPGEAVVTSTGEVINLGLVKQIRLALPQADGMTHLRATVSCASEGVTSWGLDSSGNNPAIGCSGTDTASSVTFHDFPLTAATNLFVVEGTADVYVTLAYISLTRTAWSMNDSGETYGVITPDGETPDLQPAMGVDANGNPVGGYVRTEDLNAFGPDWPGQPANPDEAVRWQEDRDRLYPNGWDIPLYRSDGHTMIGTFHIQTGTRAEEH